MKNLVRIFLAFIYSSGVVLLLVVSEFAILHCSGIGTPECAFGSLMRIEKVVAFNDKRCARLWTRESCSSGRPYQRAMFAVDFRNETVTCGDQQFLDRSAEQISPRVKGAGDDPLSKMVILQNGFTAIARGNTIEAWSPEASQPVWTYVSREGVISAIDVAGNDVCLAASGIVMQLEGKTGRVRAAAIDSGHHIFHLAVSPCRRYLATVQSGGDTCGQLIVLSLNDNRPCFSRLHVSPIFKPVFSPEGSLLVVADADSSAPLFVVDVAHEKRGFDLGQHPGITGGHWDFESNCFYSWGNDGFVRAWNLESRQIKWGFQMRSNDHVPLKQVLAAAFEAFLS